MVEPMQEQMFVIPLPPLLAFGFFIGIALLILGHSEKVNLARRHHLMGLGTIIIGIMIPVTPLTWYGYWTIIRGTVLGLTEIAIITFAIVLGVILMYGGTKTYSRPQDDKYPW